MYSLRVSGVETSKGVARRIALDLSEGRVADPRQFPWHRVQYSDLSGLKERWKARGLSPATVNRAVSICRAVAERAYGMDLMGLEDYQKLRIVGLLRRADGRAGMALTRDELERLLKSTDDGTLLGARDGAAVALMAGGGLRRSEAVQVTRADYDVKTGSVQVRAEIGKGGKSGETALLFGTQRYVNRWLDLIKGPGPILRRLDGAPVTADAIHDMVQRRSVQASLALPVTPHDLRRTFVTLLFEAGFDGTTVAHLARHSSVQTTFLYDRRNADAIRRAVQRVR